MWGHRVGWLLWQLLGLVISWTEGTYGLILTYPGFLWVINLSGLSWLQETSRVRGLPVEPVESSSKVFWLILLEHVRVGLESGECLLENTDRVHKSSVRKSTPMDNSKSSSIFTSSSESSHLVFIFDLFGYVIPKHGMMYCFTMIPHIRLVRPYIPVGDSTNSYWVSTQFEKKIKKNHLFLNTYP